MRKEIRVLLADTAWQGRTLMQGGTWLVPECDRPVSPVPPERHGRDFSSAAMAHHRMNRAAAIALLVRDNPDVFRADVVKAATLTRWRSY